MLQAIWCKAHALKMIFSRRGSERFVPLAPDSVSWVAWDAIRNEQAERRRQLQGIEVNEGRAATRARFGDG